MKKTLIAATFAAALLTPSVHAEGSDKLQLSDVVQSVKFSGDLRLRDDLRGRRGPGLNNLQQQRYRLRFGFEAQLPDDVAAVFAFASGSGEQVSTNQTAQKLDSQKPLWIDLAYMKWKTAPVSGLTAHLFGGRMVNPLWRTYSSDLLWDDDVRPEGLAESVEYKVGDSGVTVFANGLQMVADQDSNSGKNQYLFSEQVGAQTNLPMESSLRMAAAYHKWSDEGRSGFTQSAVQDGNRRQACAGTSACPLANRFGVGELTAEVKTKAASVPVSLQATVARNLRAHVDGVTVTGPRARDGYQFGLIVGSAKKQGQWEAAYFKKYVQSDATVADVADSDFGDGGTNHKGHIAWIAYNPRDWMQVKAKGFVTDTIDRSLTPGDKAVNRLQLDLSVKF